MYFPQIRYGFTKLRDMAQDRGSRVNYAYALDILDKLDERATREKREPDSLTELQCWMLNGASNWFEYSESGKSLVNVKDIAERWELNHDNSDGLLALQGLALHFGAEYIETAWQTLRQRDERLSKQNNAEQ